MCGGAVLGGNKEYYEPALVLKAVRSHNTPGHRFVSAGYFPYRCEPHGPQFFGMRLC